MAFNFRNSNVVLNKALKADEYLEEDRATYSGVARKTLFFLLMTLVGAGVGILTMLFAPSAWLALVIAAGISTFVLGLISFFAVNACKVTGTLYCLLEGVLVGSVSYVVSTILEGAVTAAVLSTIAVFLVVAALFTSNIVKVNSGFIRFLIIFSISFIVGQILFLLANLIFKVEVNYGLELLLSGITIFLATLYLFFDLEHIRQVVEGGREKKYEWYVAFGLAYTVVWLYFEILRIILIFYGNKN